MEYICSCYKKSFALVSAVYDLSDNFFIHVYFTGGLNLIEQDWQQIPASASVAFIISIGFYVVFGLISFLFFHHGVSTSYHLDENSIQQFTQNKQSKWTKLLLVLGFLTGNRAALTATGAGLLAKSRELISTDWDDLTHADFFPTRNEIRLKNNWRTVMQVVCEEDDFESIKQIIKQQIKNKPILNRDVNSDHTSLPKKVVLSLLILILGSFLFIRLPVHYVGSFALATIVTALFSVWGQGRLKTIMGGLLFLMPLLAVFGAYHYREIDFNKAGSEYAFMIEILIILYFIGLSIGVLFKRLR
ncbi:MAG TPA: hypothetical protein PK055_06835 [Gammaproteobacteria bacterium]|nr:hypothetical protein [Xanthomonadales bacterium]HOP22952.1 hypothetical protein [Gammaproteobacteria bacterium]HPI95222.1 hypothetical protein [Gammaproteobacteria bacterium]HPQ87355.1 hypothetical protein [Gammaproteobacteria bacterium]